MRGLYRSYFCFAHFDFHAFLSLVFSCNYQAYFNNLNYYQYAIESKFAFQTIHFSTINFAVIIPIFLIKISLFIDSLILLYRRFLFNFFIMKMFLSIKYFENLAFKFISQILRNLFV